MSLNPFTAEILENHPRLTAEVIDGLSPREIVALLKKVKSQVGLRMISPLSQWKTAEVMRLLPKAKAGDMLNEAPLDETIHILLKLPSELRKSLVGTLKDEKKTPVRSRLSYPGGTVGAWMNSAPLSLPSGSTVGDVLATIHGSKSTFKKRIMNLYIVDKNNKLKGLVPFSEVLLGNDEQKLRALMRKKVHTLGAYQTLRLVGTYDAWEDYDALPVLDPDQVLVGELTQSNLRKGQNALKPRPHKTLSHEDNPLRGTIDAGEAFLSGVLQLLPKTSGRN